jgi:hypothetical protein
MGSFHGLQKHGSKVYKFKQDKSIAELEPPDVQENLRHSANKSAINRPSLTKDEFAAIKSGVCAALACAWLKEKLTSDETPVFTGKSELVKNVNITKDAATNYLEYKKDNLDVLIQKYGLVGADLDDDSYHDARNLLQSTKADVPTKMANVCDKKFLQQGRGVYIPCSITKLTTTGTVGGGHAVAAYRSRGNTLYFFDPNAGVYQVKSREGFFKDWVKCYNSIADGVTVDFRPSDQVEYFSRAAKQEV